MAKVKTIIEKTIKEIKDDREEFLERLKNYYPTKNEAEIRFVVSTILTENAIINELEDILKKAEESK